MHKKRESSVTAKTSSHLKENEKCLQKKTSAEDWTCQILYWTLLASKTSPDITNHTPQAQPPVKVEISKQRTTNHTGKCFKWSVRTNPSLFHLQNNIPADSEALLMYRYSHLSSWSELVDSCFKNGYVTTSFSN